MRGATLTIAVPGHLQETTEAILNEGDAVKYLYPLSNGVDVTLIRELVYGVLGGYPNGFLSRPTRNVALRLAPELNDSGTRHVIEAAAARVNAVNGVILFRVMDVVPEGSIQVDVRLDPSACPAATGAPSYLGGGFEVVGGVITFCKLQQARRQSVVAHELGHILDWNMWLGLGS